MCALKLRLLKNMIKAACMNIYMCVCVCVCVCVRVRARVRACVCVCARARARAEFCTSQSLLQENISHTSDM